MKALGYDERIRRAQVFLDQARRVSLAGEGPSRGGRLQHKRSLLMHAHNCIARLLAKRPPTNATTAQIAAAQRLAKEIDDEPTPLLDEVRKERKK